MMLPSHLAATVLLGLLAGYLWPMDGRAWFLALLFGVVMDLDHLIAVPKYLAVHGVSAVADVQSALSWGANWQGFMHTPWALLVVIPAVLYFRTPVPMVFWALHLFLDFVVAKRWVRWGSGTEWVVVAGLVTAIGAVLLLQHRHVVPTPGTFTGYVGGRFTRAVVAIAAVPLPGRRRAARDARGER